MEDIVTEPTLVGVIRGGSIDEIRQKVQALLGNGYVVTLVYPDEYVRLGTLPILDNLEIRWPYLGGIWPYLVCKIPDKASVVALATEPTMVGIVWSWTTTEARKKVQALRGDGYIVTFVYKEELAYLDALPVLDDQGTEPFLVCKAPPMPVTPSPLVGIIWAGSIAEVRQKLQALRGDGYVATYIHKDDRTIFDALPVLDDQGPYPYLACKVPTTSAPVLASSTKPIMGSIIWAGSVAEARQKLQALRPDGLQTTLRQDGYVVTYIHKNDRALLDKMQVLDTQGTSSYLVCKMPTKQPS